MTSITDRPSFVLVPTHSGRDQVDLVTSPRVGMVKIILTTPPQNIFPTHPPGTFPPYGCRVRAGGQDFLDG